MGQSKLEKLGNDLLGVADIGKDKTEVLKYLKIELEKSENISSARVYGSWLHSGESADLDLCVMVPGDGGIVDSGVYRRLKIVREEMSEKSGQGIDLVPHTLDEIDDFRSDLYLPRYNPALCLGHDIKSKMEIKSIYEKSDTFTYADLAVNVLLDNRTICRRQILRSLAPEESKIFSSKLLHGPGNALTYYVCRQGMPYLASPSDLQKSLMVFDQIYKVDSKPANNFLLSCKNELSTDKAYVLLKWYEHLVALVLHGEKYNQAYNDYCLEIGNIDKEK